MYGKFKIFHVIIINDNIITLMNNNFYNDVCKLLGYDIYTKVHNSNVIELRQMIDNLQKISMLTFDFSTLYNDTSERIGNDDRIKKKYEYIVNLANYVRRILIPELLIKIRNNYPDFKEFLLKYF